MVFYLIRHSITGLNSATKGYEIMCGSTQAHVTEPGLELAKKTRKEYDFEENLSKVKNIYCSTLDRTLETANAMFPDIIDKVNIHRCAQFDEIDFGDYEKFPKRDMPEKILKLWNDNPENLIFPNGDSMKERAIAGVGELKKIASQAKEPFIVISSSTILRLMLTIIMKEPLAAFHDIPMHNCNILKVSYNDGEFTIDKSDVSHYVIESKSLNRKVELGIVVPEKISRIFIMLHGHGGSSKEVDKCFPVMDYAKKYHMLIVIPDMGNRFYLDPGSTSDNPCPTGIFLTEELPNYVIKKYNLDENMDIVIGGYSMGGFGAVLHGLKNPERFKGIISVSGAFIANEFARGNLVYIPELLEEAYEIFEIKDDKLPISDVVSTDLERNPMAIIQNITPDVIEKLPPIVLTCATKDGWYRSTVEVKEEMAKQNIKFSYYEIKDGGHDFHEFDESFRYAFSVMFG